MTCKFIIWLPFLTVIALSVSCGRGAKSQEQTDVVELVAGVTDIQIIEVSDSLLRVRGVDTIYFGRVKEGTVTKRHLKLYNAGEKPFVIVKVDKTCGCVELDYPRNPLKAGRYGDMPISFDSKGLSGFIYKTVTMQTSLNAKLHLLVVIAEVQE